MDTLYDKFQKSVSASTTNLTLPYAAMNKPFCGERWEFSIAAYNEVGLGQFSEPKPGWPWCWRHRYVGDLTTVTILRCWWRDLLTIWSPTPKPAQWGQNKIQIRNFVVAEVTRSWARLELDLPIFSSITTEIWIYVSIAPQTNEPIRISPTSNWYVIPELRPTSHVTVRRITVSVANFDTMAHGLWVCLNIGHSTETHFATDSDFCFTF